MNLKAIRAYLSVNADELVTVFTGQLVKTLVYSLSKEIRIMHGIRGIISPMHISPLFTPGRREFELGELVTPTYYHDKESRTHKLVPLHLDKEYLIHIGGEINAVETIQKALEGLKTPLAIKYGDNIITFKLEKIEDITKDILKNELNGDRVTLYLKGPVKPFNVLAPSRLPKFSPSAYEILITGYMIYRNTYTLMYQHVLEAMKLLGMLVETYYSLNTIKPILIPFKEGKEPALIGKITYIVDTKNREIRNTLRDILNISEIAGVGESRTNGFGTVAWSNKR